MEVTLKGKTCKHNFVYKVLFKINLVI